MNTIDLGDVTITRVVDWVGPVSTVDVVFPDLDADQWAANRSLVAPDFWNPETNSYLLALQSWVIRTDGQTIVVDTAVGDRRSRPNMPDFHMMSSDYLGALAAAGVDVAEVDLVVNTHLHVDHVGWNTREQDGEWVPTFPNATYLFPQPDLVYWHPDATTKPTNWAVNVNVWQDSIAPIIEADRSRAWSDSYQIDGNVRIEAAPGHTPGQSVVTVSSNGAQAMLVGDVIHTPIQTVEPGANSCFCEDAAEARKTRARVLGWAADHNALLIPGHLPGHGALEVSRAGEQFTLTGWAAFDADKRDARLWG